MGRVLLELEPDGVARLERTLGLKVDNGNDQDELAIGSGHVNMLGRTHELSHLDGTLERTLLVLVGKQNLLGRTPAVISFTSPPSQLRAS